MGPCLGCGRAIVTWWGSFCWTCAGEVAEKLLIARAAAEQGTVLRAGKPKSFREAVG